MKLLATIPTVMVMQELPNRRDTFILKRGAYDAPGEKVTTGTPAALPDFRKEWPANRLDRLFGAKDPMATRSASHELMLDRRTGQPVKDQPVLMRMSELRARISSSAAPPAPSVGK